MPLDVRESGLDMTLDLDIWDGCLGSIGFADEVFGGVRTVLDDFFRVAAQEHLSDEVYVVVDLGVLEMERGVKRFCESDMLLCDDAARYAIRAFQHGTNEGSYEICTDLSRVTMNLSVSSGFIFPSISKTPIAKLGMTVRCSFSVSCIISQNLSLSLLVRIS